MSVYYKSIPDFPGHRAGDDGSIWRWYPGSRWDKSLLPRWKLMKCRLTKGRDGRPGCLVVDLSRDGIKKTCTVATLVLRAFVGPRPLGYMAYHFPDPDPGNCRLENLRWVPKGTQNLGLPGRGCSLKPRRGAECSWSVLDEQSVVEIRRLFDSDEFDIPEIAELFHVSKSTIRLVIAGKIWAHVQLGRRRAVGMKCENHRNAVLKVDDVREIRKLAEQGASNADLAHRFGLDRSSISRVVRRHSWKWVS